ncbi:hypothetical protein GCM10023196_028730 [Actinoallomurus vinaceus]|uniref:Uncharacterized protein n=1 Tax=Actinoallomurus vinaceus TaxID=1080074 RepID=A0ABP8U6T2_9ACTN
MSWTGMSLITGGRPWRDRGNADGVPDVGEPLGVGEGEDEVDGDPEADVGGPPVGVSLGAPPPGPRDATGAAVRWCGVPGPQAATPPAVSTATAAAVRVRSSGRKAIGYPPGTTVDIYKTVRIWRLINLI